MKTLALLLMLASPVAMHCTGPCDAKPVDYVWICAQGAEKMQDLVKAKMAEGWVVYSAPMFSPHDDWTCCQVMVKY
jgi:hypothetical protein